MQTSSQFLIKMLTVFLDLKKKLKKEIASTLVIKLLFTQLLNHKSPHFSIETLYFFQGLSDLEIFSPLPLCQESSLRQLKCSNAHFLTGYFFVGTYKEKYSYSKNWHCLMQHSSGL